jgi:hypothetical protein
MACLLTTVSERQLQADCRLREQASADVADSWEFEQLQVLSDLLQRAGLLMSTGHLPLL